MSSGLPNISQNNEQILNDIQSLQQMEQNLFNSLETNPNLSSQQQQQIVEKMNQLSTMRINLYQTLNGVNNFFQNALQSSVGTLKEQTIAISIVESELNESKKRLKLLENDKNDKIRLVEINNYYGDKYQEHSQMMKIIIFTLVPIIILAILYNKRILPQNIYYGLVSFITVIGLFFGIRCYVSILMRDTMNYQEYDWYFDAATAPGPPTSTSSSDPWKSSGGGTCVGEYCCSSNATYDASLNICVLNSTSSISIPTSASSTSSTSTTTESFATESMINNVLTKKQSNKYNSDINMSDNYQDNMSNSFINN